MSTETLRSQAGQEWWDDCRTNVWMWLEECVPGQGHPKTCPGPLGARDRKWNCSFPRCMTSELEPNGSLCAAGLCRAGLEREPLASEGLICKRSLNLKH